MLYRVTGLYWEYRLQNARLYKVMKLYRVIWSYRVMKLYMGYRTGC